MIAGPGDNAAVRCGVLYSITHRCCAKAAARPPQPPTVGCTHPTQLVQRRHTIGRAARAAARPGRSTAGGRGGCSPAGGRWTSDAEVPQLIQLAWPCGVRDTAELSS